MSRAALVVAVFALVFSAVALNAANERLDSHDSRLDRLETPTTLKAQSEKPARGVSQRIERLPDGTVCIVVNGAEVETGRVEASRTDAKRCGKP